MKRIITLVLVLVSCIASINAAQVYWIGGASGAWTTNTNWSSTSGGASCGCTPAANDEVYIETTTAVTAVPAITLNKLIVNGATSAVTLTGAVANTITINGATANVLVIPAGASLILNTLGVAYSGAGNTADISGTLNVTSTTSGAYSATNSTTTVAATTGVLRIAANATSTATNLIVNGTVQHAHTAGGSAPTATWNTGSTLEFVGQTSSNTVGGLAQAFHNVTINLTALVANTMTFGSTPTAINGTLTITSTGTTGSVKLASVSTIATVGAFDQTGGTFDLNAATLGVNGTFNQSGGTITNTNASYSLVNFKGTTLQAVTLGTHVAARPYGFAISNNAGINLTGTMPINAGGRLVIGSTAAEPITNASSGNVVYSGSAATPASLIYADAPVSAGSTGNQFVTDKIFPSSGIAAGTLTFQVFNSGTSPNNVVTMNTTGGRSLTKPTSVYAFILSQGVLDIKNTDLSFASYDGYDPLASYNAGKMIVATGTAQLKLTTAVLVTSITFPIGEITGTVEYAGVRFVYSTKSASSTIGVKVTDGAHPSVGAVTDYYRHFWTFTDDIGAGTYSFSNFEFKEPTTSDVGSAANMRIHRWNGSAWSQIASAVTASSGVTTADVNGISLPNQTVAPLNGMEYTCRTANPPATYTWLGGATGAYTTASNWSPARSSVDPSDILLFDGTPAIVTVTGFASETIGKLVLSGNVDVAIQSSATATLSIGGGGALTTGDVLTIPAGCKLRSNGTSFVTSFAFAGTSRTATVAGDIFLEGTVSHNFNTLNCVVTVNSPGTINVGGTTGTSVTNGTSTNLVMASGTSFNVTRSGANVPLASFSTGSNVNVGTSGTPVTSTFTLNMPTSGGTYNPNVTMYYNNTSVQTISLGGATTCAGTWNLNTSGTAKIRFSGTSANTWTFNNQVSMTCSNTASGIELSTASTSGTAPIYTFGNASTTAPSLSVTGGALSQQATTSTTAGFTTVNIGNGLTIGNNGSLIANTNTGSISSGDFQININKGDVTFGTGTTMTGTVSSSTSTSSILQFSFLGSSGDQNFTPAVTNTSTSRSNVTLNKSSGNLNILTRSVTLNGMKCTSGKLILGSNSLTITKVGTNALTAGLLQGSASNWIVTDGTGTVTYTSLSTSGTNFPIGASTTSYDPFTALPSATVTFTVKVAPGFTTAPRNSTLAQSPNREWTVTSTGSGTIEFGSVVATYVGKLQSGTWTEVAAIGTGFNGLTGFAYTNASSGAIFSIGSQYAFAPVNLTTTATGTIAAQTWSPNIARANVDNITIAHDVTLDAAATMGNLTLGGSNKVTLGANNLTVNGAITGNSATSYVVTDGAGALVRPIPASTTGTYSFPVGTSTTARTMSIQYTAGATTGGTLGGRFVSSDPGSSGLPITEGGQNITSSSPTGYWNMEATTLSGGTYTATVDASGFNRRDMGAISSMVGIRLIKRPSSGSWASTSTTTMTDPSSLATLSSAGLTGFSDFGVGGAESVLPVEFTTINAKPNGTKNTITWTTANEVEVKEFAIERSTDNNVWSVIGTTKAVGGSKITSYTYNDENPSVLNYYRIKSIELSGKEQVSKVVAVKRNGSKFALVAVSPIPTTEGVTIDFTIAKNTRLTATITDIVGKVVKTQSIEAIEGNNSVRLDVSNIAQGVYILSLNDGETTATQRIVKN